MAIFTYNFIDSKGKKRKASLDAEGIAEAKEKLRAQGVLVISVEEAPQAENNKLFRRIKTPKLSPDQLITFSTQLASLLTAGMPLYESLVSLEEQYRNESFHPLLLSLAAQIQKGNSLSSALKQFSSSFSPLYCAMVAAGESVGALDASLEKLAELLSKQRKLKKQLITALLYPLVLFSFSLLVCTLLLTFVIPSLETLFEERSVNRFTEVVMGVSHFLLYKKIYYIPLLACFAGGVVSLFTSKRGELWRQKNILSLPLIKNLVIQTAMARFCRTMGGLLSGGVEIIQALQISKKVMRNPFLEAVVEKAESAIIEGSQLSKELKKSPLVPPLVPRMLSIAEEGGNTAAMFQKIADLYEEDIEKTLSRITALAQPVILILMGGIVGLIMLAVLLPLTDANAFL